MASRRLRRAGGVLGWWAQRLEQLSRAPRPAELELLRRNRALEGIAAGRPGFVIGNGSSLARQDLRPLANEWTFVANAFFRHSLLDGPGADGTPWQPSFYSIVDPLYFDGSTAMREHFALLCRRVRASRFLVPAAQLENVKRQGLLPIEQVYPCLTQGDLAAADRARFDLTQPIYAMINVAILGMLAAIYAGCRPIYLLGLDHDWLATPQAKCRHFYPGVTVQNHAEVAAVEAGRVYSYTFNMECLLSAFRSYEVIRRTAEELGVEILNATDGGFLDVFPRVRYEDVLTTLAAAPRIEAACGVCASGRVGAV